MTSSITFYRAFAALVMATYCLGIGPIAHAQTPLAAANAAVTVSDDPIAHYRNYEAAIARGDMSAASHAATLAWQTGERVWNGSNPNLPGLAFNAAWALGLNNKIAEAQAPAQRAMALGTQFPGNVEAKEAEFLVAYSNMMLTKSKRNLEAFNLAAKALDNGGWGDFLLARAYVDGAQVALEVAAPRTSRDLVDRGLAEATRIAPGNIALRTNLLVLRTQSSLQLRQYTQAVTEVMEARRSYGVPKSERDVNWAALAAWEAASRAVYASTENGSSTLTGSRISRPDEVAEWPKEELTALSGQPAECKDLKITRRGPPGPQGISFPSQEQRDLYAGGAYIRARLDGEGKVISTDILSALPRPAFGIAAQQGMRNWRYEVPTGTPQQCQFVDVAVMYAFTN